VTRRKSGGREARIALRSAPLTEDEKPVKPGEIGGRYKPLSNKQVQAIEVNVYRILEEIGLDNLISLFNSENKVSVFESVNDQVIASV